MTHKHEWIPWEDEPWFFTCKDENCPRVLDKLEVMERVNTIEMLIAEDVYADIMEGTTTINTDPETIAEIDMKRRSGRS